VTKPLDDILHFLTTAAGALAAPAIGSAIAQVWESGLSWGQRLIQWVVGICVSYYVTGGMSAVFHLDPFVNQSIGFMVAMVAFRATPAFIASAVSSAGGLPSRLLAKVGLAKADAE